MADLKKERREKTKEKRERREKKERKCIDKTNLNVSDYNHHITIFLKSISTNYIFFLTLFFCFYKLRQNKKCNSSYTNLILSFLLISINGYITHYLSHIFNYTDYYNKHINNKSIITKNNYLKNIINGILYSMDFHSQIHHNNDINISKTIRNTINEFTNNVFSQGLTIVILIKLIDIRIVILWAFLYATVHIFNYSLIDTIIHKEHHTNPKTNLFLDTYDILFNTKYDINNVENFNHGAINLLIITYIIDYFT